MESDSEMPEPFTSFVSTLIPLSETVSWKIHNVSDLLKNHAFTAVNLPLEVGWGGTGLSKWELSLHSSSTMLQARLRLLDPSEGQRITHHATFWVKRRGRFSLIKNPTEYLKGRETCAGWAPTYWKLLPLEDLRDEGCGILDLEEDSLEFIVKLAVFGSDLSAS